MTILFIILVLLASLLLGFVVLVQNPKGGGLSGNIAGFSNQFMGVKQTTDVLEKGTWLFSSIVGVLCLISVLFIGGNSNSEGGALDKVPANQPVQQQTTPPPANLPAPAPAPQSGN